VIRQITVTVVAFVTIVAVLVAGFVIDRIRP
jgi:hypothetical protein